MRGLEAACSRSLAGVIGCTCLVSTVWSHGTDGSHRDRVEQAIESDDVYELCLVLMPEQQPRYVFRATHELDFNIHYHASHEAFYHVPEHQTAAAEAIFTAQ